ncbi:MAG: type II secretion system GspH family protein [Vampirovibrionales bacterium]|jgi:prepilin-type N-terminal cleavage/methylation domain-containing protein|nr:type II secretion system GspH family protein [Vampirovibrionales bacterium]
MKLDQTNCISKAFTLSEVLIVLGIIGLLSAIIIPSFIENQTRNNCAYLIKSSILASNSLLEEAFTFARTNLMDEAVERLTTIRNCGGTVSNATTGGCWNTSSQHPLTTNVTDEGVVLKNNAVIVGFKSTVLPADELLFFEMDANGVAGPNFVGVDQINLVTCTTRTVCQTNAMMQGLQAQGYKIVPGQLLPADAQSVALYDRVFERI